MKNRLVSIISALLILLTFPLNALADERTDTISITVVIGKVEIIEAAVEFRPEIIRPRHRYIRCYIELPEPYKVENIDVETVALTEVNADPIDPPLKTVGRPKIGDYDRDGISDLRVWFNIRRLTPLLKAGENSLTIIGNMKDGKKFKGTGTISVIKREKRG